MAAGRVDVLRRDSHNYCRKEFEYGENGVRGVKARFNGYRLSVGSTQNGFRGRTGERGFGSMSNATKSRVEDSETSNLEYAVEAPSKKKRKFSPIVWDREEKEARVVSKDRVLPSVPLPSLYPSPHRSDVASDADVSKVDIFEPENLSQGTALSTAEAAVADGLVGICQSKNPADLSPSPLLREQYDKTHVQMEEEVLVEARNISMSRWASDSDSPRDMSDDECTPNRQHSSPESGEFRREDSVGGRTRTFASDEEGSFLGSGSGGKYSENDLTDKSMVIDENDGENVVISQVESDSEYDDRFPMEEPTVSSQRQINMLQGCRSVFEYEKLNKINEGTYGVVYKAKDKKTGEIVALKKVKMDIDRDGDGFPMSSLREINILLSLNHPSIVGVKEVVMGDLDSIFMVMEYMEYDLKGLMEAMNQPFSIGEVKWLMLQLLEGIECLHGNWVLHRDLKTSNILLNKEGELKICDFGLSRQYGSPLKPYTPLVVTLWYRAPEILLGARQYSTAIDMWSVGCIMAEMVAKEPLFRGKTEVDQLDKIFKTLGTPNETVWPGFSKLPGAKAKFVRQPFNTLRKKFPAASFTGSPVLSDLGFDLLSKLLTYDPEKRITVEDALNHDWFREAPLPKTDFKPSFPELNSQKRYLTADSLRNFYSNKP
ncbi:uncharacterized protein LOC107418181 isoform X1 [Ziziphus jujuba]|uniref:cyclin-dependent kinase n=2 Tax=Ziziphus jujuba TaxID=326968 RepID=A0A6P4A2S8_ZIZJJ|nr:uncharacterized protein LOC107418181 isoform X1 [Ziziphus jujuba]